MFTVLAFGMITVLALYVERANRRDRESIFPVSDGEVRQSILHARQDLKFIAFMLAANVVMLGIIADRIH